MLLALRSLWEALTETATTSGGSWPAQLLFNLRQGASAYLRRAFAWATAGEVEATGEAGAESKGQRAEAAKAGKLSVSAIRCLPVATAICRSGSDSAANPLRSTAGAIAILPSAPCSMLYAGAPSAKGILGVSEDELALLMLAAA
jgi:hypothetical protein